MTPDNASALASRPSRRRGERSVPDRMSLSRPARPALRSALIPRPRLVRRLVAAAHVPVALIVAPAGYGKSTLLWEWSTRDDRPFVWVSREPDAADPRRLGAVAGRGPLVLVLDDAHVPTGREAGDLAGRLPPGSTLALASRRQLPRALGRLRVEGAVVELGPRDLAMTRLEAALLFDALGVRLAGEQLDRLVDRTGGWPAGLQLAARSLLEQPGVEDAPDRFGGADRLVADYIRDELLADLSSGERAFVRRTSILERLTPGLCDAVLGTHGSGAVLSELARGNVPLEPLDRCDSVFRYHPLLAEMLRAELAHTEPELEAALHGRAADWHSRRGDAWSAVGHALAGRDPERAGRLLWSLTPSCAGRGRAALVERWLERFTARELSAHAWLALAAATCDLATGRRDDAERWADTAESLLSADDDRDESRGAVALLRACIARDGVRRMADDALRARSLAHPASPWLSLCDLVAGVAHHLTGHREAASELFESGARRATRRAPLVAALCHAQLALLAVEREDWGAAREHAQHARAAAVAVADAPPAALAHAVCAFVAAHEGDVDQARCDAVTGRRLLASLTGFTPWFVAETQIWLARAHIRLTDAATARTLLARAARIQGPAPDAPVLWRWLHEGWECADAFAVGATGEGPSLTTAELRVLRFLPSHMSFKEIAACLHVSANTVKTQALSVYRKLDVTCRSDAVSRGRSVGLLDA